MKRLFKLISRKEGSVPCSPFPVPSPISRNEGVDPRSLLFPVPCSPFPSVPSHKGFTLIEMLVVIGIIAILTAAGLAGYNGAIRAAQRSRGNELVQNLKVALGMVLQDEDAWPAPILKEGSRGDGRVRVEIAAWLGKHGYFSFGTLEKPDAKDKSTWKLHVNPMEELGILTPWGESYAKKLMTGGSVGANAKVPGGGTLDDHVLRFAVDDDYDGFTEVKTSASGKGSAKVRASACVWCCGFDGKFGTRDDIFSWTKEQEVNR